MRVVTQHAAGRASLCLPHTSYHSTTPDWLLFLTFIITNITHQRLADCGACRARGSFLCKAADGERAPAPRHLLHWCACSDLQAGDSAVREPQGEPWASGSGLLSGRQVIGQHLGWLIGCSMWALSNVLEHASEAEMMGGSVVTRRLSVGAVPAGAAAARKRRVQSHRLRADATYECAVGCRGTLCNRSVRYTAHVHQP